HSRRMPVDGPAPSGWRAPRGSPTGKSGSHGLLMNDNPVWYRLGLPSIFRNRDQSPDRGLHHPVNEKRRDNWPNKSVSHQSPPVLESTKVYIKLGMKEPEKRA